MIRSLNPWILAARFKTLPIGASPILIGTAMAMGDGYFSPWIFVFTLLTGLLLQIGSNYANDYFDFKKGADTTFRKGSLRVMQAGLVTHLAMKRALILLFAATVICGSFLIAEGGIVFAGLLALGILTATAYTGGPFPLGYLGLGEATVFFVFGPIAVLSTYYLQTHELHLYPLIASIIPGSLAAATMVVNNYRDIEEDRIAHKKTIVVRFGKTFGKIAYALFLFASLIPILFLASLRPQILICLVMAIPCLHLWMHLFKNQNPFVFNLILVKTAKALFFYTVLFSFLWML